MNELLARIKTPQDVKALPAEELPGLAEALRAEIMNVVSHCGGHLSSNLGVVELTIALMRVFSPPRDKLIFDVSHQTYAYKLLTGRAERFHTLRQLDGISGFLKTAESEYDAYGAGHAGTALSAAMGFAAARDRLGGDEHVVAIVGDASMSNGFSFEALNNLQASTRRLIVVLNDNEMAISQNVGSLGRHLGRLLAHPRYNYLKASMERTGIERLRMSWLRRYYYRIEAAIKSLMVKNAVFEEFGLRYVGPIDGHDLSILEGALRIACDSNKPILLHIATRKGRGYKFAEEQPAAWHGAPAFDQESGKRQSPADRPSYSRVFGQTLARMAEKDPAIVAITAAMKDGTGLAEFAERFPERFFDVGICEGHQAVFAAGLAARGMKPVVAIYSTFLQRSIDALIHDVALQGLPVVFCVDRAGAVAADGPTHHGLFDLSMLRSIPGLTIMQPASEPELVGMLKTALSCGEPAVIRYPRDYGPGLPFGPDEPAIQIGKAQIVRESSPDNADSPGTPTRIALWALGDMLKLAGETAELLEGKGLRVSLINARFARPLDTDLLRDQIDKGAELIATFENSYASCGFGSMLRDTLAADKLAATVVNIGWPDEFIPHAGETAELMRLYGLTPEAASDKILARLADGGAPTSPSAQ